MLNNQKLAEISRVYGKQSQVSDYSNLSYMSIDTCIDNCYSYMDTKLQTIEIEENEDRTKLMQKLIKDYVLHKSPRVAEFIENDMMNHGKLEDFLIQKITKFDILSQPISDESVSEIQVNDHKTMFLEIDGKYTPYVDDKGAPMMFNSPEDLEKIIHKLLKFSGQKFTKSNPMPNTTTSLGFRISATHSSVKAASLPPYHWKDCTVVIRKIRKKKFTEEELISTHSFGNKMNLLLKILAQSNTSVLVVGSTGSGKSSVLDFICCNIPDDIRTIFIQNPTEVRAERRDVYGRMINNQVYWEAIDADSSDKTANTYYNLTMHALRNTPDKMIFGEWRRSEEYNVGILAATSGHDILGTAHSASVLGGIWRCAEEVKQATNSDIETALTRVCDNIHFVITQKKLVDTSRKITQIAELCGTTRKDGILQPKLNMIFEFIVDKVAETNYVSEQELILKSDVSNIRNTAIEGNHYYMGPVSDACAQRFLESGILPEIVNIYKKTEKVMDTYIVGGE